MKHLYNLLVVFVLLALVAACAPTAATPSPASGAAATEVKPAGEKPIMRVWIEWGDNPAQLQELFNKYGNANNVTVEVNAPVETDKIIAALSGSEPPDILITSGADLIKSWDNEGLVTSLNDLVKSANIDLNDIYPAPLSMCQLGDKLLCLPWGTDVYALFWNKDVFEAAGLDPEKPPTTMEQLAEFADKLTKVESDSTISQVGFIPDFSWGHLDLYVRMFGGFWYSDDGTKVTINSQSMVDALKWEQPFYSKYNANEVLKFTSALGGYMSPDQGFYAGKIAMMVDGEWQTGPNFISKFKPELNYGVAPFPPPATNPERANTIVVQGTVVIIPSGAKDKEASAKLFAWMESPEILAEEMLVNYNLPTSKKAAADPRFLENPKFKVFMDLLANPNAKPLITTPISSEVNDATGSIEEQVVHADADPLALLEEAQDKFQPLLDAALSK